MKSLEEVKAAENEWIRGMGGPYSVTEGDWRQNKFSRAIIRAFKRKYGTAFLGKVNLYGDERHRPYELTEYRKGMVYNFEFSFVVPCKDADLEHMIVERDNAPYTGTRDDYERITKIFDRIEALNGYSLRWV